MTAPTAAPTPAPDSGPGLGSGPALDPTGPAALPTPTLRPTRLRVPRLGIDVALDRLGVDERGELARPPHWQRPGWYADGAVPGEQGPAVIAGHVDSPSGPAVFWRLADLRAGDRVTVTRSDRSTVTFRVTKTTQYPQDRFPTAAVYGPTPGHELRLITCAGTYDHAAGRYRDNRVVFASADASAFGGA
ncbi:class F sortase [Motilibacter sp. E257]|uniref:Class F sortase n=2 Tax=Motilibacter deserti TaxID=2714956 RepID=A0ABX0GUN9_9ACTN|nr:class F sortase [Motilibacter deserti]NHC13455.1 class F sortase [Motilibacter deserti]